MNSENLQNRSLRNIFGKFATGVSVVSFYNKKGTPKGITVNSFSSVSLDPPIVLWCLADNSDLYGELSITEKYIFNFLSSEQKNIATTLSEKENHCFDSVNYFDNENGPIIEKSLGWISCSKKEIIKAGDHLIILGLVNNFEIFKNNKKPLIFWSGKYQDF
mgnify:CR=1 FL=1|tara:strand:- start:2654 stop:3136 length:483 start_codon:yes stop_codon:yes gene_type:complete